MTTTPTPELTAAITACLSNDANIAATLKAAQAMQGRMDMPPGMPPAPAPPPSAARIGLTTASSSFCFASYSSFSAI